MQNSLGLIGRQADSFTMDGYVIIGNITKLLLCKFNESVV